MIALIIISTVSAIACVVAYNIAYKIGFERGYESGTGLFSNISNGYGRLSAVGLFTYKRIIRDLYNDRDDHDKTIAMLKNPEIAQIIKESEE